MVSGFLKYLMYLSIAGRLRKFYASLERPGESQVERLTDMIGHNADTEFGRDHLFAKISNVSEYKRSVPIRSYNEFKPYLDRMLGGRNNVLVADKVSMFGVTSGSTAEPKFIPITRRFTVEYHNSHLLWMYNMVRDRDSRVIGSIFSMVSPAEEGRTVGGIPFGSSSGKQYRDQSIPIRALHPIPYSTFLLPEMQTKYHVALTLALRKDLRVINSVNPSTLITIGDILARNGEELLADMASCRFDNITGIPAKLRVILEKHLRPVPARVARLREILKVDGVLTPRAVWPNICAINTWQGGSAAFYLDKVKQLWGNAPQRCFGLRATEGMFTVPLRDSTPSAVLAVNGHFMEFAEAESELKPDSPTLLASELEHGKRYRLIITTSSGLYRYDLGDIVEVTGRVRNTPEVAFLHKAGGVLSLTGEKVYESHIVEVMSGIAGRVGYEITGFTVTVELQDSARYVLLLELAEVQSESALRSVLSLFDSELSRVNCEYRDKRCSGRLQPPIIYLLKSGTYDRYRELLVKRGRPDGQIKPLHLIKPYGEGRVEDSPDEFIQTAEFLVRVE